MFHNMSIALLKGGYGHLSRSTFWEKFDWGKGEHIRM